MVNDALCQYIHTRSVVCLLVCTLTWAFDIHEVGVGTLNQPLLLVPSPLSPQIRMN